VCGRTGAANFSASGLKRQDNDLIVIEAPERRRRLGDVVICCGAMKQRV
jgi:hypothetical protein